MSKLIKHEFRASSRLMLIILSVCFLSAVLASALGKSAPDWALVWLMIIFGFSVFALIIMTYVILIGRFYKNTMTDTGYLTMTLPVSTHQFVWGELITSFLWLLISIAVWVVTGVLCGFFSGVVDSSLFANIFTFLQEVLGSLNKYGTNLIQVIVLGLELIVAACLVFILFSLRFYCAMSVGQLFSNHRGLMAVIAYFIIGMIISIATCFLLIPIGNIFILSMDTVEMIITDMGLVNLGLAICGAIVYFPTVLILSKKLNLP